MGGLSIWHWLIVGIIILLLFGKGRFSDMMGDVAKGLKSFKKGMSDEEETAAKGPSAVPPQARINDQSTLDVPADRTRDIDPAERREP